MSELKKWVKRGGGTFRMGDGRIIKPTEVFSATEEKIPKAFRDTVRPYVGKTPVGKAVSEEEAEGADTGEGTENTDGDGKGNTPEYEKVERSRGWYNIVDKDGKVINENALREDEADKMLEELQ